MKIGDAMKGIIKNLLVCLISLMAIACVFVIMALSLKEDIKQNNTTITAN